MKRIVKSVAVILLIISLCFVIGSCSKNKRIYDKYFNDFISMQPYTKAVSKINLDSGVSVFSYDSAFDVFVTKQSVYNQYSDNENKTLTLYGLCSLNQQYVNPIYTSVLAINGDYAIVTKPYTYYEQEENKTYLIDIIGVIRYRGENAGDRTDFTNLNCYYNMAYDQFTFVGDYIAVPGSAAYPSASVNFTTFYEYKAKDKLLEVFRINKGYDYAFDMYDDIIISQGYGSAFFYNKNNIMQNGFLDIGEYDTYKAFPEDINDEYTDFISIQINYLGNGWFVRTSRLESETEFYGYNIIFNTYDAGTKQSKTIYARVRTDLYNFNSKNTVDNDWLLVDTVANKYSQKAYAQTADALNNLAVIENERYTYYLPVLNPACFIKDGYSIVYFYYLPYLDKGSFAYEISFCLIDQNANIIRLENILMPPVFIDGIGIQNVDPTYESIYGNFLYLTKNNKKIDLCKITDGQNTFETVYVHNKIVIGTEYKFSDLTIYYGAFDADTKKQVLPFIYKELAPFYGDYSIGVRTYEKKDRVFRIDKNGKETLLNDVVNIRQGTYVYENAGKLGVKNYEGSILVEAKYDKLEVYDVFNCGNSLQKSFVMATSGAHTYIMTLE